MFRCRCFRGGRVGSSYSVCFHRSCYSLVFPRGLHREFYRVVDLDLFFESDFSMGVVFVKRRVGGFYGRD